MVTGRVAEMTSTTATIDFSSADCDLKPGQMVRARLGNASTTTIVTAVQPSRLTSETRYELQFLNTTPAFRATVREHIVAMSPSPAVRHLRAA